MFSLPLLNKLTWAEQKKTDKQNIYFHVVQGVSAYSYGEACALERIRVGAVIKPQEKRADSGLGEQPVPRYLLLLRGLQSVTLQRASLTTGPSLCCNDPVGDFPLLNAPEHFWTLQRHRCCGHTENLAAGTQVFGSAPGATRPSPSLAWELQHQIFSSAKRRPSEDKKDM